MRCLGGCDDHLEVLLRLFYILQERQPPRHLAKSKGRRHDLRPKHRWSFEVNVDEDADHP
jgi:hypothetical protein